MIQEWSFKELDLKGAYLIKPFYSADMRGNLVKDYNCDIFVKNGLNCELKETYYTTSKKGVIRSTHFQMIKPQPKLMRCISGKVYYVMVDLRPNSSTYGQWKSFVLDGNDMECIYIPGGFGQGYLVLEDAMMSYKASEVFFKEGDSGIMYDDPDIGIDWPLEKIGGKENLIISNKDLNLMSFKQYSELVGQKIL